MSRDPSYTEFEQGERQALLQVRSFIARHGTKEVGDYAAQRLHDIKMDALRRMASSRIAPFPGEPEVFHASTPTAKQEQEQAK